MHSALPTPFPPLSVWVRKESVRQGFAFGSFLASSLLGFQTSVGAAEAFPPFALTLSSKIFWNIKKIGGESESTLLDDGFTDIIGCSSLWFQPGDSFRRFVHTWER